MLEICVEINLNKPLIPFINRLQSMRVYTPSASIAGSKAIGLECPRKFNLEKRLDTIDEHSRGGKEVSYDPGFVEMNPNGPWMLLQ